MGRADRPAPTVEKALARIYATEQPEFAVLDVNIQDADVFPVADALTARGVPFAFTTGRESATVPQRNRHAAALHKLCDLPEVSRALSSPAG